MSNKLARNGMILFVCWWLLSVNADCGNVDFLTDRAEHDYAGRFRVTYHLGSQFNKEDIDKMIQFLRRPPIDDVVSADELASLKNNVADVLIAQKGLAEKLLDVFLSMYADALQGVTWRNYVVQKIPAICVQLKDRELSSRALNFLWSVARDQKAGYICEAFLGLDRINSARPDQVSSAELCRETLACLESIQTHPEVKGIVVQILAKHDGSAARQKALSYLGTESSIMLKASSLAVLGKTGHPDDIAIIKEYTLSADVRLGEASRAALRHLQQDEASAKSSK
jgi:hypothetical protein